MDLADVTSADVQANQCERLGKRRRRNTPPPIRPAPSGATVIAPEPVCARTPVDLPPDEPPFAPEPVPLWLPVPPPPLPPLPPPPCQPVLVDVADGVPVGGVVADGVPVAGVV